MKGLSLVELLVALLISMLSLAAAMSWLAQGRMSYRSSESLLQLQESADAALELLAGEARLAGYLGSTPPGTAVAGAAAAGTPEPAALAVAGGCGASLAHDLSQPLDSADDSYRLNTALTLGCAPGPLGRAMAGSDTLTLRHANASASAPAAGRLQLETHLSAARLLADGSASLGPGARWHELEVGVYYVSPDSTAGTGLPSLRRKRLVGGLRPAFQDEELVADIADLQVELGLDDLADADDAVDQWLPAGSDTGGSIVRALRLWVLARSPIAEGQPLNLPALSYANRHWPAEQSPYRRHLASQLVQLRNGIEP